MLNRAVKAAWPDVVQLQEQIRVWLIGAITGNGLGAKTACGYGWFRDPAIVAPVSPSAERLRVFAAKPLPGVEPAAPEISQDRPRLPQSGRQPSPSVRTTPRPLPSSGDPLIDKWRGKLDGTGNFPAVLPDLAAITDIERLRRVFQAVFPEHELRKLTKGNRYWQSFASRPQGKAILDKLSLKLG